MLSDVYFPRVNGVSTSIETFRATLAACGVEVRLIAPRYGDEPDQHGITRVPARRVAFDPEDRLMAWKPLREAVRREAANCDLIHVQTPFAAHYAGLRAARERGIPVLATYHTFFEEYLHHYAPLAPRGITRAIARRFSRAQCNDLDAVIVPSMAMRERLMAYGVERPMHVLPTGIPLARFAAGDRGAGRARFNIPPDRPVALFVGRVAHEKNIDFLIDAVAHARDRVPDLLLLITGEGPASQALRARVARLGLERHVAFLGYLDRHRDLPDCYAAADVFVFASRTETQGLVLLEAMAMGTPVVALAAMGTRDILGPGRGCLVPRDDIDDFAAKLVTVLLDGDLRARLAKEATNLAAEWSDAGMARRLAALYGAITRREGESVSAASCALSTRR
jgi:glycosyltransferase involved in cell wall biosynthesis